MAIDPGPKPQREINKLKALIKKLQKDKERSFPDLGRAAYRSFLDGNLADPGLAESCNRIRAFDDEIERANADVARLQEAARQMKAAVAVVGTCASCGAGLTAGLRFCGSCGAPVAVGAPPAPAGAACPACGAPVTPGSRFCGECGASLEPADVAAPPPSPAPPVPATAPLSAPSTTRCPACGAPAEEEGAAFCGECGARL